MDQFICIFFRTMLKAALRSSIEKPKNNTTATIEINSMNMLRKTFRLNVTRHKAIKMEIKITSKHGVIALLI